MQSLGTRVWEMGKKTITEADVDALARDGVIKVSQDMIITPLAREYASRKGIRLVYAKGAVPSAEHIRDGVETGAETSEEGRLIEAIATAIASLDFSEKTIAPESPVRDARLATALADAEEPCRAVVVSAGINRPGIAAALTTAISECGGDIQDISQTIVGDFFSMVLVVNIANLVSGLTFRTFKERVEAAGRTVGAETTVFHEAILRAMHRV